MYPFFIYIIDGRGSELSKHLFSKKMVFTSKHNMEMKKSEKLLKKKKKNFSWIFFDMTSSNKGRVQDFPNTYFQQFF